MPQKTKHSPAEKIAIVEAYLIGELSAGEIKHIKEIPYSTLYKWVRLYKQRGAAGLFPALKMKKYTPEVKQSAVMDYLNGAATQLAICKKYDISDTKMLRQWIKKYNGHKDSKNGGEIYMAKGRTTTFEERIEIVSHCISNNQDYSKTIKAYGVSYQQIYAWIRKYEKDGADGLIDRRGKSRPESSMTEIDKLQAKLKLKEAEVLRLQMDNELLKKLEELERGLKLD